MLFRSPFVQIVCVSAAVSLFGGCSVNSPATPGRETQDEAASASRRAPATALYAGTSKSARAPLAREGTRHSMHSWFARTITHSVFLADPTNGAVDIFAFDSRMQSGVISGLSSPEGLATDPNANLYIADTLTQTIKIYAPPYSGNPTVLDDKGYYPVGVHVDASGNVYVANICSGSHDSCLGNGNTVVYKMGSHTPTPLSGGPGRAYFVAIDASGNVWVDGQVSQQNPSPEIGYFAIETGTFVPVAIDFAFPGGIAFDRAGNLLLDDQAGAKNGGSILRIYPPAQTKPKASIALQTDGDDIVDIALGTAQARIFAPGLYSGDAAIITYPRGATVNSLDPLVGGELDAVAVTP